MDTLRDRTKTILQSYLTNAQNVTIFEKLTYDLARHSISKEYNSSLALTIDSNEGQAIYKHILYDILYMIKTTPSLKEVVLKLKEGRYGFDSEAYNDIKYTIQEQDEFLINPFEVKEGLFICGRCGSNKTFSYPKQTRAADEGTTVFVECFSCGKKWSPTS